jgi:hypothetical protein
MTPEQIETKLSDITHNLAALERKPFGCLISEEVSSLYAQQRELTRKLHEVQPFKVIEWGEEYIVSERGSFIDGEDGEFLKFSSLASANAHIKSMLEVA